MAEFSHGYPNKFISVPLDISADYYLKENDFEAMNLSQLCSFITRNSLNVAKNVGGTKRRTLKDIRCDIIKELDLEEFAVIFFYGMVPTISYGVFLRGVFHSMAPSLSDFKRIMKVHLNNILNATDEDDFIAKFDTNGDPLMVVLPTSCIIAFLLEDRRGGNFVVSKCAINEEAGAKSSEKDELWQSDPREKRFQLDDAFSMISSNVSSVASSNPAAQVIAYSPILSSTKTSTQSVSEIEEVSITSSHLLHSIPREKRCHLDHAFSTISCKQTTHDNSVSLTLSTHLQDVKPVFGANPSLSVTSPVEEPKSLCSVSDQLMQYPITELSKATFSLHTSPSYNNPGKSDGSCLLLKDEAYWNICIWSEINEIKHPKVLRSSEISGYPKSVGGKTFQPILHEWKLLFGYMMSLRHGFDMVIRLVHVAVLPLVVLLRLGFLEYLYQHVSDAP